MVMLDWPPGSRHRSALGALVYDRPTTMIPRQRFWRRNRRWWMGCATTAPQTWLHSSPIIFKTFLQLLKKEYSWLNVNWYNKITLRIFLKKIIMKIVKYFKRPLINWFSALIFWFTRSLGILIHQEPLPFNLPGTRSFNLLEAPRHLNIYLKIHVNARCLSQPLS